MREDRSIAGPLATLGDELKSAIVFLTRLSPSWIGATADVRPDFTVAARMFPLAGALIGAVGGVVLVLGWLLDLLPFVTATLAVATTVILTGALHEDGLADFADSFGGATRERKLQIMDDSRIGTYGACALVVSLLLRAAALAAILPRGPLAAVIALIAGEAVSRAAVVRMWHDLPSARAGSLANDTGPPEYSTVLIALAIAAGIVVFLALPVLGWRSTALASVLSIAGAYGVVRLAANVLGGRTGDALGACQQVALAALLVGASSV